MEEKTLLNATLCFLVREGEVLLAIKTQKIGKGCWNGYGGGIDEGETPIQATVRELGEESEIITSPEHLTKVAVVDFHNTKSDGSVFVCRVHVFLVKQWVGEPKETDEMITPTWFKELPLDNMMLADKFWLPPALSGKKITATAKYGPFQQELIGEVTIQEVEFFPED